MRMSGNVGSVTRDRYDELVKLGRDWVATMSSAQWRLGDAALEIEPMRSYGGANPSGKDDLSTVSEAIRMFAEDVGLAYSTAAVEPAIVVAAHVVVEAAGEGVPPRR